MLGGGGLCVQLHSQADVNHCKFLKLYTLLEYDEWKTTI